MVIPQSLPASASKGEELFAESEAEYFVKGRDVQIVFMRDRKGQVTHALVRINGVGMR